MKYIIIPILKFIWALILTIIHSIYQLFNIPLYVIWHWNKNYPFQYEIYKDEFDICLSPYWKCTTFPTKLYTFKSYYHYIWNIK